MFFMSGVVPRKLPLCVCGAKPPAVMSAGGRLVIVETFSGPMLHVLSVTSRTKKRHCGKYDRICGSAFRQNSACSTNVPAGVWFTGDGKKASACLPGGNSRGAPRAGKQDSFAGGVGGFHSDCAGRNLIGGIVAECPAAVARINQKNGGQQVKGPPVGKRLQAASAGNSHYAGNAHELMRAPFGGVWRYAMALSVFVPDGPGGVGACAIIARCPTGPAIHNKQPKLLASGSTLPLNDY